jgi:hypothetical protein
MVVGDILTSAAVLYATTEVRKPRGVMVDHLNRLAMTSWRSERKLLVVSEDVDDSKRRPRLLRRRGLLLGLKLRQNVAELGEEHAFSCGGLPCNAWARSSRPSVSD